MTTLKPLFSFSAQLWIAGSRSRAAVGTFLIKCGFEVAVGANKKGGGGKTLKEITLNKSSLLHSNVPGELKNKNVDDKAKFFKEITLFASWYYEDIV